MTVSAESLKNRDQDSWTELYERYVPEILGFVSRLVNSKDVAEDLLQKIWLQAARGIDNFDPDVGEIRSWLFTVARRQVALYWCRQLSPSGALHSGSLLSGNELIENTIGTTLLPDDIVEQVERSSVINAALLSMSLERRDVLIQKYREGWSCRPHHTDCVDGVADVIWQCNGADCGSDRTTAMDETHASRP
jgi:RNA polymerase sigma-70 factor (ECF subfamily)